MDISKNMGGGCGLKEVAQNRGQRHIHMDMEIKVRLTKHFRIG
jgi:hypothetical protein